MSKDNEIYRLVSSIIFFIILYFVIELCGGYDMNLFEVTILALLINIVSYTVIRDE